MEVFSLHVCLHTTYMPVDCGGWKRVMSPAARVIDHVSAGHSSLEELPVLLITDPSPALVENFYVAFSYVFYMRFLYL